MKTEILYPVAKFLLTCWGENPDARLKIVDEKTVPHTDYSGKYPTVVLPNLSKWDASSEFLRYRLFRATEWHEAMHVKYTPAETVSKYDMNSLMGILVNAVEDYRIEWIHGYAEYPPMKLERDLSRAYFWDKAPYVGTIDEYNVRMVVAFVQKLLLGAIKGDLEENERKRVIKAVDTAKSLLNAEEPTVSIAEEVAKILGIDVEEARKRKLPFIQRRLFVFLQPSSCLKEGKKPSNLEEIKNKVKNYVAVLIEEGEKEFEGDEGESEGNGETEKTELGQDSTEEQEGKQEEKEKLDVDGIVKNIMEGSKEVRFEFNKIQVESKKVDRVGREAKQFLGAELTIPKTETGTENIEDLYDWTLINMLKNYLKRWKTGWREYFDKKGEFDVESYIAGYRKCFIEEEKSKFRKPVMLVLDMSGSIAGYDRKYKRAIIAFAEAFKILRVPFAIFVFQGVSFRFAGSNVVYIVKGFQETWNESKVLRLASIKAAGSTPMSNAYRVLRNAVKKYKPIVITLTDGAPDNTRATKREIQRLKKITKTVAIGIGHSIDDVITLTRNLRTLGYDRLIATSNLREIPAKILKVLWEV